MHSATMLSKLRVMIGRVIAMVAIIRERALVPFQLPLDGEELAAVFAKIMQIFVYGSQMVLHGAAIVMGYVTVNAIVHVPVLVGSV